MSAWKMTGKKDRKKAKRARHGLGRARAMPVRVKVNRKRKPGEHKKVKLKSHKGALKRFYQTGDGTLSDGWRPLGMGASAVSFGNGWRSTICSEACTSM